MGRMGNGTDIHLLTSVGIILRWKLRCGILELLRGRTTNFVECGRGDVFARRFDNVKTGKKGYSPCCENQWVRGVCGLLRGVKCAECPNRNMLPVSDEVIRWHLQGKDGRQKPFEMGTYPMAKDETVTFAVIDFDESSNCG